MIQAPIARWLTTQRAQDRIHFVVLTKGIPLRVRGSVGRAGTVASVDSELTLLYRRMTGKAVPPAGPVPNPYFLGDRPVSDASPFTHAAHDFYLVTRLDGFTIDDALRLVDFSLNATSKGQFLLDEKASWLVKGNLWLRTAAERLRGAGLADRVVLEQTSQVLTNRQGVLGYYSWGSNDPAIKVRTFGLTFLPGALGVTFVSSDARTFRPPPEDWRLGYLDRSVDLFRRIPTVAHGRPDSGGSHWFCRARRRALPGCGDPAGHSLSDLRLGPFTGGVVLPRNAKPQLADGRHWRPLVFAVCWPVARHCPAGPCP